MSRTVLLLDVTAMAADAVCIAGLDLKSSAIVRLAKPQPTKRLLALLGDLTPGDVIDIDLKGIRKREAPHVEDCEWKPRSLKKQRHADAAEVVAQLRKTSFASVVDAFGPPVEHDGERNAAWQPNAGTRSLATIRVKEARLTTNDKGRLRISFVDNSDETWAHVPYQDLRARSHIVACGSCQLELEQGRELDPEDGILRVGLTRPYAVDSESEPLCWLQVTSMPSSQHEHLVEPPANK